MRLLFPVAIALTLLASSAGTPAPMDFGEARPVAGGECLDESRYFADRGGRWQDKPVRPQKLGELPPAETFAAVLRRDERGCMVPVKYRDIRR